MTAQNAKVPSQQACPMLFHRYVDYDSMAPRYLALDTVSTCIMRARPQQRNFCHLAIALSHSLPPETDLLHQHSGHAFTIITCLVAKAGHMAC